MHETIDFTGSLGVFVNHKPAMRQEKKPKRGTAAEHRAAPFKNYFEGDRLHKVRMRHKWYRDHGEAA